jgi:hypothetical protein
MPRPTTLTEEQQAELDELIRRAETGEDWAEICRREAGLLDGAGGGVAP